MLRTLVTSSLRRLLAVPALGAGEDPTIVSLRGKLKDERRRAAVLDAKLRKTTAMRRRIAALKRGLRDLQEKMQVERRQALSSRLLADLLPVRAAHPIRLESDRAIAVARERRLVETSAAYRESTEAETTRQSSLQRIEISGIPWWIPLEPRLPERAQRAAAQSFPFRALLQTREIGIGGIMLDLGANIGRTSITRVILGDVRAVYAAEPEPLNYACLVQNVVEHHLRGLVLPDRVAIGAERGEMRLQRSKFMGGHRVLSADAQPGRHAVETVAVQVWPLDEWIEHHGIEQAAVTFVKVDTQGFEANVLRGAPKLLAQDGVAWQLEIEPGLLARAGSSVPELLALVARHFTHAIDMTVGEPGPRVMPVATLPDALSYLGTRAHKTDVLLYRMPDGRAQAC